MFVLGCKNSGVYGNKCTVPCPSNCRDSFCHIQKGTCFGCKPGWEGTFCDKGIIEIRIQLLFKLLSPDIFQNQLWMQLQMNWQDNKISTLFLKHH